MVLPAAASVLDVDIVDEAEALLRARDMYALILQSSQGRVSFFEVCCWIGITLGRQMAESWFPGFFSARGR